jgi:hypothetical protein
MFINNKYTKWYFQIINSGYKEKLKNGYYEKHHIIPKALGGSNSKNNLVYVTGRQHFLLHLLLLKMTKGKEKRSMSFAYFRMRISNGNNRYKEVNFCLYEQYRKVAAKEISGERNPFYGKGHFGDDNPMRKKENYEKFLKAVRSKEHRKKMSKLVDGEKNPFYGKVHTKNCRKHLALLRSKPVLVTFINKEKKEFIFHGDLGDYINMSRVLGSKLCKSQYSHLWNKYGISNIERI